MADPKFEWPSILVPRDGHSEPEPIEAGLARSVLLLGLEVDVTAPFAVPA